MRHVQNRLTPLEKRMTREALAWQKPPSAYDKVKGFVAFVNLREQERQLVASALREAERNGATAS